MLSLIRSLKNTFAPINKVPADALTLISDYWEDTTRDQNLITLTHVCRGWREIFTSRPSLWARLDCANVEKTRVYIERSRSFPLAVQLDDDGDMTCWEEAFLLVAPHMSRLKTLFVTSSSTQIIPALVKNFSCRLPLLDDLDIEIGSGEYPSLPDGLFDGDLSSLRELSFAGVLAYLPWKGMSNLTKFNLCDVPDDEAVLTQLLNFFESAPRVRHIHLRDSIPSSSDVPAKRVVSLPQLETLEIIAQPAHSILLNHLSIPAGASLTLEFPFSGSESPLPSYLPKSFGDLSNLSHITAVSLCLGSKQRFLRLGGPSGELYVLGNWSRGNDSSSAGSSPFLRSLSRFNLSRSRRLAIQWCNIAAPTTRSITKSSVYRTLHSAKDLHALTLVQCNNIVFILTLNPNKNPSRTVLCPSLQEITLYIKGPDDLHVDELLRMAEGRASRDAKLSVITIISTGTLAPPKNVFQLREHVSRVECKFDDAPPRWDSHHAQAM